MLSIVSIPKLSSVGYGAIVGGNVDMSATGPISLSNWNSASGFPPLLNAPASAPASWALPLPLLPAPAPACPPASASVLAETRARSRQLYRYGVCMAPCAACSSTSATSFTSPTILDSWSRKTLNSGRRSCVGGEHARAHPVGSAAHLEQAEHGVRRHHVRRVRRVAEVALGPDLVAQDGRTRDRG